MTPPLTDGTAHTLEGFNALLESAQLVHASPETCDLIAGEAVALGRSVGADEGRLGRACLLQATARYRLFDYPLSHQLAMEAAELLSAARDCKRRARALNLCLIVCIETGELLRALEVANRALADARANGDVVEQARLLLNQAVVFEMNEEFGAAVRCLDEAIALSEGVDAASREGFVARVNLAEVLMGHADREQSTGQEDDVAGLRRRAAETLPAFDGTAPPSALTTWISLKARLGFIDDARAGAIVYLRRIRRAGQGERFRAYALLALGELHVQAGRADKGAHRLQRAVSILRAARNWSHLGQTEVRLARLCADREDHVQALRWLRQAHEDERQLHGLQQALRWRQAALEREAESRRAQREEKRMHRQRLAVIGRLLSEVYHALVEPIASTHAILESCMALMDNGATGQDLVPKLKQVLTQVDEATALVRQLKVFSYRAAPQPTEVSLAQSVQDAWHGVALWRQSTAAPLEVAGEIGTVVDVDAQRLAVLLRILFIEAERSGPAQDVRVDIENLTSGARLQVSFRGTRPPPSSPGSVGFMLCTEIAQELNGSLARAASTREELRFELQLPPGGASEERATAG